jgi:glutamine amidotransferase
MIAVVDYGMGNLRSVQKAFEFLGYEAKITSDKSGIKDASHVVVPGVGAFRDAMENLGRCGLTEEILKAARSGKPFLGICLGMQILFDKGREFGEYEGLGLIPGEVVPFDVCDLKVPHMGWNTVVPFENPLIGPGEEKYVYFVHSYHPANVPKENILAVTEYGYPFVSAVMKGNIFGLQFHPEKSGDTGLAILKNFAELN